MVCGNCRRIHIPVYAPARGWEAYCPKCGAAQRCEAIPGLAGAAEIADQARGHYLARDFAQAERSFHRAAEMSGGRVEYRWGELLAKYGALYGESERGGRELCFWREQLPQELLGESREYGEMRRAAEAGGDVRTRRALMWGASEIDEVMWQISDLARGGAGWDVMLCCGGEAPERQLMDGAFAALSAAGLRVFYAPRALEDKPAQDIEAHVHAALRTAKLLVVAAGSPESAQAPWVRSAWERFRLWGKGNRIALCPVGFARAEDFPGALREMRSPLEAGVPAEWAGNPAGAEWVADKVRKLCADFGMGGELPRQASNLRQAGSQPQDDADALYQRGVGYSTGADRNDDMAAECFRRAASMGHAQAQYRLGRCYEGGQGVEKDYAEAAKWYLKAAERGSADAQNFLGTYYYRGQGVAQNYVEAVKWFQRAAAQGHREACYNLGQCHHNGRGVPKGYAEAAKWYLKAAEQGDADAQNYLGIFYSSGKGMAKDHAEAAKWYMKAAAQGHKLACYNLGSCYHTGRGVAKDYAEAAKWYLKAAEQGDADAQNYLGNFYFQGWGVAQDYAQAVKWIRMAAAQGHAQAQSNLGVCYRNGWGVAKDLAEALKWYRLAAAQGHEQAQEIVKELESRGVGAQAIEDPAEMNRLGLRYFNGDGVARDYAEAVKWFRMAAEEGHAGAQRNLGDCYRLGLGVAQDDAWAADWYESAGKQGDLDALFMAIELHKKWENFEAVEECCRVGAELGSAEAQYLLGNCREDENLGEAAMWWRRAAMQGHAQAQWSLGRYFSAEGDAQEAARWYVKAAEQGHEQALRDLERLRRAF